MTYRSMHQWLPRAITFDPIFGYSGSIPFRKQEDKIFLEVSRSIQFQAFWSQQPNKSRCLKVRVVVINSLKHPSDRRETTFSNFCSLACIFLHFSLSSKHTQKKKKKPQKTHPSFLILLSSPKTQGIVLISNLSFLGSTVWIWGLGVCL